MKLEDLDKFIDEATNREKEIKKAVRVAKRLKKEQQKESSETGDKQEIKVEKLQEAISEEVQETKFDGWKPYEIKEYTLPEFKIPVKKSNNYEAAKRQQLSKILAFIEFAKRKRLKTGCTAIPIPTTSRVNLMIWGYPKAISRAIKFMEEIGLISVFDDSYRFGVPFEGANYGKTYCYYKDNEDKVIQYCKDNNIFKYEIDDVEEIETEEQVEIINGINEVKEFDVSKVRFGRNLNLEKPEGFSKPDFEMYLTQCLYVNYPEFKFHRKKVKEINDRFYENYPEFRLRFKPRFTWNGNTVVKIGIRVSNEYCCKEKEERRELLYQYGFHLEKDVRSSVPRLTLSINTGHWIDEDIDIYKLINDEFDPSIGCKDRRRELIKKYVLPIYFEDGSDKMLAKNITYKYDMTGVDKKEVDDLVGRLRQATLKAIGGRTYGSDIFYIESCVYLMTVYDLLTSGHMVWLVYDAFYSNGEEDQETFESMLRHGIKMNFRWFLERSNFKQYSEGAVVEDSQGNEKLSVEDISKRLSEKHNIEIKKGEEVL